jgi:hypothetical protein
VAIQAVQKHDDEVLRLHQMQPNGVRPACKGQVGPRAARDLRIGVCPVACFDVDGGRVRAAKELIRRRRTLERHDHDLDDRGFTATVAGRRITEPHGRVPCVEQ